MNEVFFSRMREWNGSDLWSRIPFSLCPRGVATSGHQCHALVVWCGGDRSGRVWDWDWEGYQNVLRTLEDLRSWRGEGGRVISDLSRTEVWPLEARIGVLLLEDRRRLVLVSRGSRPIHQSSVFIPLVWVSVSFGLASGLLRVGWG